MHGALGSVIKGLCMILLDNRELFPLFGTWRCRNRKALADTLATKRDKFAAP